MKFKSHFEFHFCYQEPGGAEVIAFDVYFCWRTLNLSMNQEERNEHFVIRAEGNFVDEGWETVPLFDVRYCRDQKHIRFRNKRDRLRVPLIGCGSGGNWHWEVILVPASRAPHLLNWLRRQKRFGIVEWDTEFRETVWERRGPIRLEHLRTFKTSWIRDQIERAVFTPLERQLAQPMSTAPI